MIAYEPIASLDPDALVPGRERGAATLLVGGSLRARAEATDALLAGLESLRSRPLVVRVRTRENAAIEESLVAAAEDALRALGAPGGLYDDPSGGPFASLGAWIFRARTVGRHGVLLVLDEIDGWLDARGQVAGVSALGVIERALDESARGPVAVLCSVRAADASGDPALAEELVKRFAHVMRLGGAPVFARDPLQLVGVLAGRSFSLANLHNALAGWLELPDAGADAVVTFTAPLGPPHIGTLPDGEPLDWSPAHAHEAPAAQPEVRESPTLGEGWADALRAALEVRDALRAVRRVRAPHGVTQIERLFRDGAARLPLALRALALGERALGVESSRVRRAGEAALAAFERDFAATYATAYVGWVAGAPRPAMLCDLPARVARVAAERGARGTATVVLTGLRLDLWLRLRARVLPRVPGLVVLDEGVHWAARPTTPGVQRELVARGFGALGAELPVRDEPPPARTLAQALEPRREHVGRVELLRIDAYATELLRSHDEMVATIEPIERALPNVLLSLCGSFAGRTVFALAGDVGMRDGHGGEGPVDSSTARYSYGGDSPFEAIVPYALLVWG